MLTGELGDQAVPGVKERWVVHEMEKKTFFSIHDFDDWPVRWRAREGFELSLPLILSEKTFCRGQLKKKADSESEEEMPAEEVRKVYCFYL